MKNNIEKINELISLNNNLIFLFKKLEKTINIKEKLEILDMIEQTIYEIDDYKEIIDNVVNEVINYVVSQKLWLWRIKK